MKRIKKSIAVSLFSLVAILIVHHRNIAQNVNWSKRYETVRPSEDVFIVGKAGKMAVAKQNGSLLTELVYDTIYDFHEGIAIVGKGKREVNQFGKVLSDFKYGYLTKAGQLIVDTRYEHVNTFSEGLGLIEILGDIESYNGRTGYVFVNQAGQVIINHKPVYECLPFRGNTAFVEVPRQGFWLPPYDDGRDNGHHTQFYDVNGHTIYGNYLDRQGHLLIPWKYDTIAPYMSGYLRAVRKDGKWGFLDSSAVLRLALQYDDIDRDSTHFWRGRRRVSINRQFGFIDSRNGRLIIPIQYEDSKPSHTGLVWVRSNQHWGCLNEAGQLLIPFIFSDVQPFEQRVAIVQKGKLWGTVNQSGNPLAPIKYDTIYAFQEGRAAFRLADKFGFLDLAGREVIPARYSLVSPFKQGYARATIYGLSITLNKTGGWTSIKLQTDTLKAISWLVLSLTVVSLVWWRRKQAMIRSSAT